VTISRVAIKLDLIKAREVGLFVYFMFESFFAESKLQSVMLHPIFSSPCKLQLFPSLWGRSHSWSLANDVSPAFPCKDTRRK
jgi:hypothetical protein